MKNKNIKNFCKKEANKNIKTLREIEREKEQEFISTPYKNLVGSIGKTRTRTIGNLGRTIQNTVSNTKGLSAIPIETQLITKTNPTMNNNNLSTKRIMTIKNNLSSIQRNLSNVKTKVSSIRSYRYITTLLSPCLSLVPYGSNIITIPLDDILLGNYSSLLLSREITKDQVINKLKAFTTGFYLMTVSTIRKPDTLTNMMVSLSREFNSKLVSSRKLDEKDLNSIKSIHNMKYIPSPELTIPWNASKKQIKVINDIKLYPVNLVCEILRIKIDKLISTLTSKLNTYSRLLKEARERKMDSSIIEILSQKESLLSNRLNDLSSWLEKEIKSMKKLEKKEKKDKKGIRREIIRLEKLIIASGRTMKNLEEELVLECVDWTRNKIRSNKNYPFTSSINQFKYNDMKLSDFVINNFENIIYKDIQMPGIFKEFTNINMKEATPYQMKVLIDLILKITKILQSIGWKDGFINDLDLTNTEIYPILNLVIPSVLDYSYGIKGDTMNLSSMQNKIADRLAKPLEFYREISGKWKAHTLRMFYNSLINLIVLHLYTIIKSCVVIMERNTKLYNITYYKLLGRCDALEKLLKGWMSLDIRERLKFRSPKITQLILGGFDTEYQEVETAQVKPLSAQVATYCELQLELPKRVKYDPKGVVTNTGESYIKTVIPSQGIDRSLVITSMDVSINYLQNMLNGERWNDIKMIEVYLKRNPGYKVVESELKDIYIWREPIIQTKFIDLYKRTDPWEVESLIKEIIPCSKSILEDKRRELVEGINSLVLEKDESDEKEEEEEEDKKLDFMSDYKMVWMQESSQPILTKEIEKSKEKSKEKLRSVKVRIGREINILSHYNAADLSLFTNWDAHKKSVKILNKSFASFGRGKKIEGWTVKWRDTILLTSAAKSSLKALGEMHNMKKGDLTKEEKERMEDLYNKDAERFKEYAVQDAVISLRHGIYILNFLRINTGENKIPVTLSSLAQLVIKKYWRDSGYRGYQIDNENLMDPNYELGTPKSINAQGYVGLMLPLYLAAARGGRNESMMYGKDIESKWNDYDLNGAYTTIMSGMGNPVYSKAIQINQEDMGGLDLEYLSNDSFTVMCVKFKFPDSVMYPVLPVQVDKTSTCYPLSGTSNCTGSEYVLAKKLGANMTLLSGCVIPFEKKVETKDGKTEELLVNQPFNGFVQKVQSMRKEYPKGSAAERIWKDIGNMGYGQSFQGLAGRKTLDTATGTHQFVPTSELTNPIISSWITGKARSIVGESMNNINKINKGKVVSVTTDGFITNVENLEEKLLKIEGKNLDNTNLIWFKDCRIKLGHTGKDSNAYELKGSVKGILSWRTRGQLGVSPLLEYPEKERILSAMTGYQKGNKSIRELVTMVERGLCTDLKILDFLQFRLRGANDIYKKGGNVTPVYSERKFRVGFDNKRQVAFENLRQLVGSEKLARKENNLGVFSLNIIDNKNLLETKPWQKAEDCENARLIMGRLKSSIYQKNDYTCQLLPIMFTRSEIFIRVLMRDYINRTANNDLSFVYNLGNLMIKLGKKVKITKRFVRKWLGYLEGLRLIRGISTTELKETYKGTKWLKLAEDVYGSNYFDKKQVIRN